MHIRRASLACCCRRCGGDTLRATLPLPRRRRQRPDVPEHRAVPHRGVGHRRSPFPKRRRATTSTRSTPPRAAAACGRRRTPERRGRRCPTASGVAAVGAVAIAPSNPHDRLDGHRRPGERAVVGTRARACSSPPTPAPPGSSWGCPTRTTSRASSSTRRTPTSSTSPRWGISFRRTRSAASSARRTAARPGRRCSTSTTASARSISSSTARRPPRSTRRCTTRSAGRGRSSRAVRRAAIYRTDDGGDKWTKLARRPADGQDRPHRPRHLPEEPAASSTR